MPVCHTVALAALIVAAASSAAPQDGARAAGEGGPRQTSGGQAGEVLYNGIVLPKDWPPRMLNAPRDPVTPAYLVSPPAVIPIDVGRQLFVDDFLIQSTNLTRVFQRAKYYTQNPVHNRMPFSGGIWWDPKDRLVKLFAGREMVSSKDGIHFGEPQPGIGGTITWLDLQATDPQKRWVSFNLANVSANGKENIYRYFVHFSADGVHWGDVAAQSGNYYGDRASAFYNPFRKVWVYSIRWGAVRRRRYWEVKDLVTGPYWQDWKFDAEEGLRRLYNFPDPPSALTDGRPSFWTGADSLDYARPDLGATPDLYNLDCVAYESLLLGEFIIHRGEPDYRLKINEVCLGFSRDGFNWVRPDRQPFCPISDRYGDWNYLNVQSVGGCCLVMGDQLYFYVSGRSNHGMVTGLAMLRRDGFASMDADDEGTLTTRPVRFKGRRLFVNVDDPNGALRAEVIDEQGQVIAPFSKDNCAPVSVDKTLQAVTWKGADDLSALSNKAVKFRFYLRRGSLYAFWVSPDESGASYGYVAAGGPGFTGPIDTVGVASYDAAGPAPVLPPPRPKLIEASDIAPIRVAGEPDAILPAGTRQAVIRLVTHEDALCKYSDRPNTAWADMQYFSSTGGMRHATLVKGLTDGGLKTYYVKARNFAGHANNDDYRIDVGVGDTGPAPAPVMIELHPESAAVVAPMVLEANQSASGGKAIVSKQDVKSDALDTAQGTATFRFTLPATDDYVIWARVFSPGGTGISDSFFVNVDGKPNDVFDTSDRPRGLLWGKWHWTPIGTRDGLRFIVRTCKTFPLTKGEHALAFGGRRAGCILDCIIITNDPTVSSSGEAAPTRGGPHLPADNPVGGAGPEYEGPVEVGGVLTPPVIWPQGGYANSPITVSFSWPIPAEGPETVIRYTIDGNDPDEKSTAYSGPFEITGKATVKARAFRAGAQPSAVTVAGFGR